MSEQTDTCQACNHTRAEHRHGDGGEPLDGCFCCAYCDEFAPEPDSGPTPAP